MAWNGSSQLGFRDDRYACGMAHLMKCEAVADDRHVDALEILLLPSLGVWCNRTGHGLSLSLPTCQNLWKPYDNSTENL